MTLRKLSPPLPLLLLLFNYSPLSSALVAPLSSARRRKFAAVLPAIIFRQLRPVTTNTGRRHKERRPLAYVRNVLDRSASLGVYLACGVFHLSPRAGWLQVRVWGGGDH